ncbi:MAG: hypothetical protein H6975_07715 [Gammaproteobacteria bacterium]|nr:hypothetical protein [Gammaproteobacteria bacterium]
MQKKNHSLAFTAILSLVILPACVYAQPILVGPPTFSTVSQITEDRALQATNAINHSASSATWKSTGATSASNGPILITVPGTQQPTVADGIASDTELKSVSRVTGSLGARAPGATMPSVRATNRSDITRFFLFDSSTLGTVPVTFTAFLDGEMTTTAGYEILSAASNARVTLGLDVVDISGALITNVFEVSARSEFAPGGGLPRWTLLTSELGAAANGKWSNSFTDTTPGGAFFGNVYDIDYLENFANAYQAPIGVPIGFNWYLETEAFIEGTTAVNILLESDFFNTLTVDQMIDSSAANLATMTEVLVTPLVSAVPLPTTWLLLVSGLVVGFVISKRGKPVDWLSRSSPSSTMPGSSTSLSTRSLSRGVAGTALLHFIHSRSSIQGRYNHDPVSA